MTTKRTKKPPGARAEELRNGMRPAALPRKLPINQQPKPKGAA